jgi:hypothetical protein
VQEENYFLDQDIDGRVTLKTDMNERRWKGFYLNEEILYRDQWRFPTGKEINQRVPQNIGKLY